MTLEHLPPKSAGNDQPFSVTDGAGAIIQEFSEGHAIPTLCEGCNKGASDRRLPVAYKLWREDVIEAVKATTAAESDGTDFDLWRTSLSVDVDHDYALHPGRIARQVLGMLLAVQSRPLLTEEHPRLREAYFSEEGRSIEPLTLHIALANTGFRYFKDVLMAVTMGRGAGISQATHMHLWSFPPFLAVLVDGPPPSWPTLRIDQWLAHPTSYHFQKRDRRVSYPIARRSNLLVAMLYQQSNL